MKQSLDLNTFSRVLGDKGYDGYFTTQAAYPGKLKDSLSEYLEACAAGKETLKTQLLLTGYLQWSGDDKPSVECLLWVKYERGNFELQKMDIVKKDQFGLPLKRCSITNLSAESVPKASEAAALVKEVTGQKTIQSGRRFKF